MIPPPKYFQNLSCPFSLPAHYLTSLASSPRMGQPYRTSYSAQMVFHFLLGFSISSIWKELYLVYLTNSYLSIMNHPTFMSSEKSLIPLLMAEIRFRPCSTPGVCPSVLTIIQCRPIFLPSNVRLNE